jgi:hypothetical protein
VTGRGAAIAVATLWVLAAGLGMAGQWLVGLVLSVGLMVLLAAWGTMHEGRLDRGLLLYPVLPWAALWIASFLGAAYHGARYAGARPDFTVLGLHPPSRGSSSATGSVGCWCSPSASGSRRDAWLSEARWQEFVDRVAAMNEERGDDADD